MTSYPIRILGYCDILSTYQIIFTEAKKQSQQYKKYTETIFFPPPQKGEIKVTNHVT